MKRISITTLKKKIQIIQVEIPYSTLVELVDECVIQTLSIDQQYFLTNTHSYLINYVNESIFSLSRTHYTAQMGPK